MDEKTKVVVARVRSLNQQKIDRNNGYVAEHQASIAELEAETAKLIEENAALTTDIPEPEVKPMEM